MSKHNVRSLVRSSFVASLAVAAAAGTVHAELPKGKPFQELQSQIQQTAATLQAQIDAMLAQVEQLSAASEQHAGQINSLTHKVELAEAQLDVLEAALAGKQNTITGSCPAGAALRAVHADGSVECEQDTGEGQKYVTSDTWVVLPFYEVSVTCPDGYIATGGGYYGGTALASINGSQPAEDGKGWRVFVTNLASPIPTLVQASAICVLK